MYITWVVGRNRRLEHIRIEDDTQQAVPRLRVSLFFDELINCLVFSLGTVYRMASFSLIAGWCGRVLAHSEHARPVTGPGFVPSCALQSVSLACCSHSRGHGLTVLVSYVSYEMRYRYQIIMSLAAGMC